MKRTMVIAKIMDSELSTLEKAILVSVALHSGEGGAALHIDELTKLASCGKTALYYKIQELKDKHLLSVETKTGRGRKSTYRLLERD